MPQLSSKFSLNLETLKFCREQMGLTIEIAAKKTKIKTIEKIESNKQRPTYNQLSNLSELYEVPVWAFLKEEIPKEYKYNTTPEFRQFNTTKTFQHAEFRKFITRIKRYRELYTELRAGLHNPIGHLNTIPLNNTSPEEAANLARQWLGISKYLKYEDIQRRIESKNIFVFNTSKYKGWSNLDKNFRGLCIYNKHVPIIVINASDWRKANSFSILHELGHIFLKESVLDEWDSTQTEHWCNRFAGSVLMPKEDLIKRKAVNLKEIKKHAQEMHISSYAYIVRMKQLKLINKDKYEEYHKELKDEYLKFIKKLKDKDSGGPPRDRAKEVTAQFGQPFVNAVLDTWYNNEITITKAMKLIGLKQPKQFLELASGG